MPGQSLLKKTLVGLSFLLLKSGCDSGQERQYYFSRFALGTIIEYTIVAPDKDHARAAMLKAHLEIERIEGLFSELDSTSEIYRFNYSHGGIYTNEEVANCVIGALDYHDKTGGAFDISIKPVLDLYQFQSDDPLPPPDTLIHGALKDIGTDKLEANYSDSHQSWWLGKSAEKVSLAMGGYVKGYAVDRAIRVLRENQIRNGIINAGGDLFCLGGKDGHPWRVGVQNPRQAGSISIVLTLSDMAAATSGDYQRYYIFEGERYHHILDPQTGKPAREAQSATVVAKTTAEADAWATALFISGPDEGIRLINREKDVYAMIVDSSGSLHYSRGMQRFVALGDDTSAVRDTGKLLDTNETGNGSACRL
ncbi:MAG: FAD:protein FMN transferase [Fidelibacterota bacterium]|nr:MAG: FAD:protein FMN transferase [Candidatus Neomarinimicrobiota bacterium]